MNSRKSFAALVVAGALVLAPVTAAFADDVVPPVEAVVETPVVEEVVVPEHVVENFVVQNTESVKLDICHSGSGAHWGWISPDDSGYNGHQHHELDIYGLGEATCLAKNVDEEEPTPFVPYTVDKRWIVPPTWNPLITPSYQPAIFPQAPFDGVAAWCWSQDDRYLIESPAEEALYNSLDDDGFLTQGEDSAIYQSHVFTYNEACDPPVIAQCEVATQQPTSTDLDPRGWELEGGEYVDGGVALTSSNWSDSYAYHSADFWLSEANNLDFNTSGGDIWAILLATAAGNVHYEPTPYTHALWTNAPGILPANVGGQGGPFSGALEDIVADIKVTGVYLYHTSGSSEPVTGVLHSGSYNCVEQPFDKVDAPVIPEPRVAVFEAEWTGGEPTCDVEDTEGDESVVTQERVVTTTRIPWVLVVVAGLYELRENLEGAEITTAVETRVVTYQGEPCVTQTETPPPSSPPVTPTGGSLPFTGVDSESTDVLLSLGIGSIVGGLIFLGMKLFGRRKAQQ